MGIVLGIMFTQIAGFLFATPTRWRLVLLGSAALAAFQILVSPLIIESPAWLRTKGRVDEIDAVHGKLYAGLPPREGQ
jgi:MFS family permease